MSFTFLGIAQTNTGEEKELMKVTMLNGEVHLGYILSDDSREILIQTKNVGKLFLQKVKIESIIAFDDDESEKAAVEEEQADKNPAGYTARYQLSPNALPLKKGTGYTAVNLYGPELHYTVLDNFTINLATSWIASPFTVSLKYTLA